MAARRRRTLRRLAVIPAVAVGATLLSGSWWNPLDWDDFVDSIIEGLGDGLVKLVNLAFNNSLTIVDADEWQAAFGQAAKWGGVFAIVAVAMCAIEIIAGMIASDHGRVVRGWIWAILAWPLTTASLLVFTRIVNTSDWLTASILNSISAPEVVAGSAVVTGATSAAGTALVAMLLGVGVFSTWWLALIFVGLALLPVIGLVIVLGAVTFGQIALAGFAPIALMLVGFRGTRAMSQKWVQMAVALLLTKPIAAGIITLGCAVGKAGGADGVIMGIIAVTIAVGSPALAFSFVGFAGAQIGGALTAHADKIKGITNSLTHAGANQGVAALRNRLGGDAKRAAELAHEGATAGEGGADSTTDRTNDGGVARRGRGGLESATRTAFSRPTTKDGAGPVPRGKRGGASEAKTGPGAAGDAGESPGVAAGTSPVGQTTESSADHIDPTALANIDAGETSAGLGTGGAVAGGDDSEASDGQGRPGTPPIPPGADRNSEPTQAAGGASSGNGAPSAIVTEHGAGSVGSGAPPSTPPRRATRPSGAPPAPTTSSRDDDKPGTSGPNPFGGRR